MVKQEQEAKPLALSLALGLVQKYGVKSKPEFIAGLKLFIAKVKCLLTDILSIESFSDKCSLIQTLTFSRLLSVTTSKTPSVSQAGTST